MEGAGDLHGHPCALHHWHPFALLRDSYFNVLQGSSCKDELREVELPAGVHLGLGQLPGKGWGPAVDSEYSSPPGGQLHSLQTCSLSVLQSEASCTCHSMQAQGKPHERRRPLPRLCWVDLFVLCVVFF